MQIYKIQFKTIYISAFKLIFKSFARAGSSPARVFYRCVFSAVFHRFPVAL